MLLTLLLLGCHDDYFLPPKEEVPITSDGWCAVQEIFAADCLSCHGAAALGGLNLSADAHGALVGKAAAGDPSWTLVVPGQPDQSALLLKLDGRAPFGGAMPPGPALSAEAIQAVRDWIAAGADAVCDGPIDTDIAANRHHPDGFADPTQHGVSAKMQTEACVDCHANDLTGNGPAVSCDTCHVAGWRTDCTYCHGDPVEGSGAPPVHLSGVDDGANASFIPHLLHTQQSPLHAAWTCDTCHTTPSDVLSLGHLFLGDTTPGRADVNFTAGLSPAGRWDGNGTCSNLYCHGNGQGPNGTMDHTGTISTCRDCHPDATSGERAWDRMSGEHEKHLGEGVTCWECHGATTNAAREITDVTKHVNGRPDIALRPGMNRVGNTCVGTCHGEEHDGRSWDD